MEKIKDKKSQNLIDQGEFDSVETLEKDNNVTMNALDDEHIQDTVNHEQKGNETFAEASSQEVDAVEDKSLEVIASKPTSNKKPKKKVFSLIALFIIAVIGASNLGTNDSVNTTEEAKEALKTHTSSNLPVGVQLLAKDESIEGKDYTIEHKSNQGEAKVRVWDYADVDGDYVQLIVDGVPLGDPFLIDHKPKEFSIPATSVLQVVGVRDGGGGITYAIAFDFTQQIYFNSVNVGASNTYTLIRK